MQVTSKQIAEMCGVTRGTVDRALNNRPGISAATRDKILKVADELGYRPHFLAQSLVKGETKTLGIVLFDIHNQIFSQLFHSFEAEARKHGYLTYLVLTNKDQELEVEYIHNLLNRKVDGIAISAVNFGSKFEALLLKAGIPIVSFANRISAKLPYVWIDDKQATKAAVRHIADKGYRRIIFVIPPLRYKGTSNIYVPEQRYKGFLEICGTMPDLQYDIVSDRSYLTSVLQLVTQSQERTAILCSSDIYALEVARHLKAHQVKVPEDAGIMGFDHIDVLRFVDPSLTTIDFQVEEIGRKAAELLIENIRGNDIPLRTNVTYSIVEGESL
ncbi:LacI family transcriptional regulator [Paenibacillus taihuensis]|uniref:LacI family transcriptional regulator n=1 Tax=Paenibacillus taihuensis TaxID=1156355 RepID=A0A3D9S5H9_9BACL|nr:LacI family DNA-binding transcriptional regulator [Paenibacillus taihuensis]REE85174.1 LacI family transcriptional regulator [Paenibacillus taihuensis]